MASGSQVASAQNKTEDDEKIRGWARKGMGDFFGPGLSPSIPVRSKRLEPGFRGRVTLVLGTLGGGAGRKSTGKCRIEKVRRPRNDSSARREGVGFLVDICRGPANSAIGLSPSDISN